MWRDSSIFVFLSFLTALSQVGAQSHRTTPQCGRIKLRANFIWTHKDTLMSVRKIPERKETDKAIFNSDMNGHYVRHSLPNITRVEHVQSVQSTFRSQLWYLPQPNLQINDPNSIAEVLKIEQTMEYHTQKANLMRKNALRIISFKIMVGHIEIYIV